MKILIISPKNKTLINFRGDLIKDIVKEGHEVFTIGPNDDFLEEIKSLGAKHIQLPFIKDNTSIIGDFKYYRNLRKIINTIKPDKIFSYTIKPVIYGSLAAKSEGISEVYPMITGLGRVYASTSFKSKLLRTITGFLYKRAFKGCKKVIFQNNDDLEQFCQLNYLSKEKAVIVNGSGVNMKKFFVTPLPEKPVFLMIARIIKEKGVIEFIKAAKIVKQTHPQAHFVLLGGFDKSIGSISIDVIQPYIDEGIIEFPGETNNVIPFLEKARIFVLPTYYREGLPRTILEAMSMGRAIITTDWPGCRDAVTNNFNGMLVMPRSVEDLVEKIVYFIENPEIVKEMGNNSLRLCKEKYDVKKVNKKMLEIMEL